ncbi:MAG: type II secretion system protein GspG [Deltaproteobacteria bacterium]|nr:type II secretion system protein GspG [Deltaproteobacteria bacterium]
MRSPKGRTVFEALLVIILVMTLIIGALSYTQKAIKITKEYALISELSNIRTSILIYYILNKKYPNSLEQMMDEKVILPFQADTIIDRTYLERASLSKEKEILDPFGNPYKYDRLTGKVNSSTLDYTAW